MTHLTAWAFHRAISWSRPAVQAISLVCFPTVWQAASSTAWKSTNSQAELQGSFIKKRTLPYRALRKRSCQTTTLMWLSAMYLSEILRSMTAATMPRNSLSTTISLQRLSIRCEQAAWWHSLLLKVQWIRQAQRCGSISPRELSYSEQSGFPITLSEQTQARRSQAIFSFYRRVTALRI